MYCVCNIRSWNFEMLFRSPHLLPQRFRFLSIPCVCMCMWTSIGLHFREHFHNSELSWIQKKIRIDPSCLHSLVRRRLLVLLHTKWRNTQFNEALNSDSVPKCIVTFNYIRLELIARSFSPFQILWTAPASVLSCSRCELRNDKYVRAYWNMLSSLLRHNFWWFRGHP